MKTTIEVNKQTRARLNMAKYSLGCKTLDETINRVLDIVSKVETLQ